MYTRNGSIFVLALAVLASTTSTANARTRGLSQQTPSLRERPARQAMESVVQLEERRTCVPFSEVTNISIEARYAQLAEGCSPEACSGATSCCRVLGNGLVCDATNAYPFSACVCNDYTRTRSPTRAPSSTPPPAPTPTNPPINTGGDSTGGTDSGTDNGGTDTGGTDTGGDNGSTGGDNTDTGGSTGGNTGGDSGSDTGGNTGGDTDGSTGGNTDGSTGGNTGGSTGGNTDGSTGGNTGGSTGGNTGGSTGGNTGGSTGGNTGGNTGGSTGGNTGGNTGGETGGNTGGDNGSTNGETGGNTDGNTGHATDNESDNTDNSNTDTSGNTDGGGAFDQINKNAESAPEDDDKWWMDPVLMGGVGAGVLVLCIGVLMLTHKFRKETARPRRSRPVKSLAAGDGNAGGDRRIDQHVELESVQSDYELNELPPADEEEFSQSHQSQQSKKNDNKCCQTPQACNDFGSWMDTMCAPKRARSYDTKDTANL
ncbi:unnamed protein product [Cylindrotheca closterium]|uniref:SREBP regulating gene protein n=1 Tax=Cylindrotheca closterium TaxID=2856 RepID=A0AAD2FSP4_9STRA|nr:unnamed protein product [Cylindrotheca closterium]